MLKQIRQRGFEPAIWVAPFVAEAGSKVFQQHPDWFVKGARRARGKPLPSNTVTFGGWRRGPWYALDGTHPEVQKHFETLFRTMRERVGLHLLQAGRELLGRHARRAASTTRKATRIEAYRRGMQAILRGAGDGFILGCNHPIWASFGLIHGSRSSGDVKRTWPVVQEDHPPEPEPELAERPPVVERLGRGRADRRRSSEDEYQFHATAIYASGGMILSGDDLTKIPPARLAMLRKLLPPTGRAADVRRREPCASAGSRLPDASLLCLFNDEDAATPDRWSSSTARAR